VVSFRDSHESLFNEGPHLPVKTGANPKIRLVTFQSVLSYIDLGDHAWQ